MPEFLSETEAMTDVFRRHKIFRGFNARVEIENLMRGAGGNENRVAETLNDGVTRHAILFVQTIAEHSVQVPRLSIGRK